MLAAVGLQMSQPRPLPCLASRSSKLRISPTRIRWYSSWREYAKCSHRWLFTAMPRLAISAFMTWPTSATQPPQVAPALVQAFISATVQAPSPTAAQIRPLVTLLHEQIWAVSGSASTPRPGRALPSLAGRIRNSGSAGSAMPLSAICSSVPYSAASPTSTAPSSCLPSSLTTIFL
jgi:hypothetical protein